MMCMYFTWLLHVLTSFRIHVHRKEWCQCTKDMNFEFGTDDVSSVSGGWRDFSIETQGYIDDLQLNVTAETGVLYYVTACAINGAGSA